METKARLKNYFLASFPAVAIQTAEEVRAVADIYAAAKEAGKGIVTWSATEGVKQLSPDLRDFDGTADLLPACGVRVKNAVYIMRDVSGWPFDRDPILARAFRDLVAWAPTAASCIVIVGPSYTPHPTVEKMVTVLDYDLPDAKALEAILRGIAQSFKIEINGGTSDIIRALSGLSTTEAENALALSRWEAGSFDPGVIYREKVQGVKKSGLLEIIDPDPRGMDAVGGLDLFKVFIAERAEMFSRWSEAVEYGLTTIKGVLLVGPPGTGKSLCAKVICAILGIPMLRWDVARTFASLVGETERRTAETLALSDAMAPCGLWLDEVDKAFAGVQGGGANDSGVGMKMFGQVITWMQERRKPVFLFATANDVRNLPSAFYRKGRFDEVFGLDVPNRTERKAIFAVHLKKRKREAMATDANLNLLSEVTESFVGAEIEAVIESAMFRAFSQKREFLATDIMDAIRRTVPLSRTASAEIDQMRAWSQKWATPASSPEREETTSTRAFTAR